MRGLPHRLSKRRGRRVLQNNRHILALRVKYGQNSRNKLHELRGCDQPAFVFCSPTYYSAHMGNRWATVTVGNGFGDEFSERLHRSKEDFEVLKRQTVLVC